MKKSIKSRPIIFTGHSVRSILDGTKTMTRRIMKPQPSEAFSGEVGIFHPTKIARDGEEYPGDPIFGASSNDEGYRFPYGAPGDHLWVKEVWRLVGWDDDYAEIEYSDGIRHRVEAGDDHDVFIENATRNYPTGYDEDLSLVPNKSPLFMSRWASRLTLEITGVKIERVQDISDADAIAEGVSPADAEIQGGKSIFHERWNAINGKKPGCSWADNPWAWVVSFKKVESTAWGVQG